jgi:uncharacterized protein YndB with AHSA1/START domain
VRLTLTRPPRLLAVTKPLVGTKPLVLALALLGLAACSGSRVDRDKLAAAGTIDEQAPVKASAQILIQAPPAKIWGLLTNIQAWPTWQPDISAATIEAAPALAAPFTWSTGGTRIHSTIRLFDPERAIGWTGRAFHIHAIHLWTLSPQPDGRVLVATHESMDGWLVDRFYSSRELQEADQKWLGYLKKAAER